MADIALRLLMSQPSTEGTAQRREIIYESSGFGQPNLKLHPSPVQYTLVQSKPPSVKNGWTCLLTRVCAKKDPTHLRNLLFPSPSSSKSSLEKHKQKTTVKQAVFPSQASLMFCLMLLREIQLYLKIQIKEIRIEGQPMLRSIRDFKSKL